MRMPSRKREAGVHAQIYPQHLQMHENGSYLAEGWKLCCLLHDQHGHDHEEYVCGP